MLDHISIRVADHERSKKSYSEALAPLSTCRATPLLRRLQSGLAWQRPTPRL